jgi:hypothetical protein
MDCGSTGTAAGIDPKILDNWQTEGAFSVASWEHLGYDQPPEWDTSQESSQCDADIADLGTFHGPLPGEFRRLENRSGNHFPHVKLLPKLLPDVRPPRAVLM